MPRDDRELLTAWQAGNEAAGGELVGRYWSDLVRFFLTTAGGDRSVAEDLAQDTLVVAITRRGDITTSFRAFAYGIARMKCFDARRARTARDREHSLDDELFGASVERSPHEDLVRAKLVITVLRRLEADEQLLLILKDYLGFTQAELAETFKIPQTRVAGRLNRTRRRFQREFAALELDPHDSELTSRSLNTALASLVARLPEDLAARLMRAG